MTGDKSKAPVREQAPPVQRYHTVVEGETIESIASKHNVSMIEVLIANRIRNTKALKPGMVLFLPHDVERLRGYEDEGLYEDLEPYNQQAKERLKVAAPLNFSFQFPLQYVQVTSHYGWRRRKLHEGVDFRAPKGTPVYASAAGEVIYVGRRLKGFGRMVLLDHGDDWFSLYAHLSKTLVRAGERIEQGYKLGLAGNSGRSRGAHLHFEIRKGSDPLDPLHYLPDVKSDR